MRTTSSSSGLYLQFTEGHLVFAVFTAALSVFTLEAQVVRDVLPHHSLFTLPQGARDFKEWTHVEVVLRRMETDREEEPFIIIIHSFSSRVGLPYSISIG